MIGLGDFHLIISFIGAVCTIMGGRGIKEVWSIIYAAIQIGNDMFPINANQLINRILCMIKNANDLT